MGLLKKGSSDFVKNVVHLSAKTAFAQALPFIMLPFLQKWFYSPEDFGVFSLFVSVSSVLISVASFKYEFAIVGASDKKSALNITIIAFSLVVIFSVLIFIGALFFAANLFDFFKIKPLMPYVYWLPLTIFGFAGAQVFSYWFNYEKKFGLIGTSKMIQSGFGESIKVGGGLFPIFTSGLIFGRVGGHLISVFHLLFLFVKENAKEIQKSFSWDSIKYQLKFNKEFAFYSTPSALLGALANNLHIIILATYFNQTVVGLVGTAFVYVAVPLGIISGSFSQVFFKRVSDIQNKHELLTVYRSNVIKLFLFALLITILVQLIPGEWVVIILGNEWTESLIYLKIMIWYLMVSFVSSALSFIYIRLKKQKQMLLMDVIHLLMVYFSMTIGYQIFGSVTGTLVMFTIAQVIFYVLAIFVAFYFIKTSKLFN